jgi:16S rRNA (adenine1518-N6/adenine1519-N6)-dimethyltransferase
MTSPKTLLNAWNLQAKKQLGQNFLSDPSRADLIVRHSGIGPEDIVLEIGAGLGALTIPLARQAGRVYAIETDGRLMELLKTELLVHHLANVEILKQDILRFDVEDFLTSQGITQKIVAVGNLPYHISSQILVLLIQARGVIRRAVLMFQREMAERLKAGPGGKDYGRITVMLQYCASVRSLARMDAAQFYPRPNVDSEVLEIVFHDRPQYPARDEEFLFKVVKAAFGQRRKTLKNALTGSDLRPDTPTTLHALETAGIAPERRSETLSIEDFVHLSHALADAMTTG